MPRSCSHQKTAHVVININNNYLPRSYKKYSYLESRHVQANVYGRVVSIDLLTPSRYD